MIKPTLKIFALSWIALLIGCAAPPAPPTLVPTLPEVKPSETAISTASITATAEPPIVVIATPTAPLLLIDNMIVGEAAIQIFEPGPHSIVTSPISIVSNLELGHDQYVTIELLRANGDVISRKLIFVALAEGESRGDVVTDLDFEIRKVTEVGRLVIRVEDAFGRIRSLASVALTLDSEDNHDIRPNEDLRENIVLQTPMINTVVTGGVVFVNGYVRLETGTKVSLELVDENNHIRAVDYASVLPLDESDYGVFNGEIHYTVEESTPVRLIVRTQGVQIPGDTHISSVELILEP